MNTNALIIFAREPRLGRVKTRLARELGARPTLTLYKAFIADVCVVAQQCRGVDCFIYYEGQLNARSLLKSYNKDFMLRKQRGKDLGQKMHNAFVDVFNEGYQKTVIIGTDCLTISAKDIMRTIRQLNRYDCVFGPSADGGYYLVGLRKPIKTLFTAIQWGTDQVLAQSVRKLSKTGKTWNFLKKQRDIDYKADLRYLKSVKMNRAPIPHTRSALKDLAVNI